MSDPIKCPDCGSTNTEPLPQHLQDLVFMMSGIEAHHCQNCKAIIFAVSPIESSADSSPTSIPSGPKNPRSL